MVWGQVKAEESYQAAIAHDATQALAWQGLAALYEKADDNTLLDRHTKLIKCYKQLEATCTVRAKAIDVRLLM